MFRSQCLRLINLYSNRLQTNIIKAKFENYFSVNSWALSHYSSDVKNGNFINNLDNKSNFSRDRNLANNLGIN